jgi:hypothetical protein
MTLRELVRIMIIKSFSGMCLKLFKKIDEQSFL